MRKLMISLLSLVVLSMSSVAHAYSFADWDDDVLCMWIKQKPDNAGYLTEAANRDLSCNGLVISSKTSSTTSSTKVKVAIKPFRGDWLNESIYPFSLKEKIRYKSGHNIMIALGDINGDGIDDIFNLTKTLMPNIISGHENPEITNSTACSIDEHGDACYTTRMNDLSVFLIKMDTKTQVWNGLKQRHETVYGPSGTDVSNLIVTNLPRKMLPQEPNKFMIADFNGDGVPDIFVNDGGLQFVINGKSQRIPKNDLYYLSQPDGTWLESNITHVTGTGVKKGKGLINFTHGASAGDIDGDGDIDIVVSSHVWDGNNGKISCYINQGDGHMVVRKCGAQFGWEIELGDIDNDGDLDISFGGNSLASKKEWADVDGMGDCISYNNCPRAFNGILLNDGTGNFYERGFEFSDLAGPNGFTYGSVPNISVADLDGDGDLDVVRMLVGRLYQGGAMTIEENIGNGQFRTVVTDHWCYGPKSKAAWDKWEGSDYGCWASDFLFGDFNKDGLVDIVVNSNAIPKLNRIVDGTVFLSTGKFTYDTIYPDDADYPLVDVQVSTEVVEHISPSDQEILDELAAFEAELEAELNQ